MIPNEIINYKKDYWHVASPKCYIFAMLDKYIFTIVKDTCIKKL